jgi:hypothetical protein
MCLAKSAPKRQESIAQRSSLIWTFPICGPKWSKKHSPGFTLDNSPPDWALKGATGTANQAFSGNFSVQTGFFRYSVTPELL